MGIPLFEPSMRRSTAQFLETRLWPDHIWLHGPVAADAIGLLHRGLIWTLRYDAGRLLGEVTVPDLLVTGHADVVQRSCEAHAPESALLATLRGEPVDVGPLGTFDHRDVLLARKARGHTVEPQDIDAYAAKFVDPSDAYRVDVLRHLLALAPGRSPRSLTDAPIDVRPDTDVELLGVMDFVTTGDREGCLRRLAGALEQCEDLPVARAAFRLSELAALCRLLTGDDATAKAILERAPLDTVRDAWRAIFGEEGEARIQRDKNKVLVAIEEAFDGVPFPGEPHRSLFQAQAADSWAGCDQSRDHKGRWQDLPREHILACQFALPHLGAESLPYYLPAIMSFVVREHDVPRPDHGSRWIFDSMEYHLRFCLRDARLREDAIDRHRLLTREQLAAIACFADYYRCSPEDRMRWHAIARGAAWPT